MLTKYTSVYDELQFEYFTVTPAPTTPEPLILVVLQQIEYDNTGNIATPLFC